MLKLVIILWTATLFFFVIAVCSELACGTQRKVKSGNTSHVIFLGYLAVSFVLLILSLVFTLKLVC